MWPAFNQSGWGYEWYVADLGMFHVFVPELDHVPKGVRAFDSLV